MLEQSGILSAPGMGSVFLFLVFFCFLIVNKILKIRKENKDATALHSEAFSSSQAAEAKNAAGVVAAITAAVTEYRKRNS